MAWASAISAASCGKSVLSAHSVTKCRAKPMGYRVDLHASNHGGECHVRRLPAARRGEGQGSRVVGHGLRQLGPRRGRTAEPGGPDRSSCRCPECSRCDSRRAAVRIKNPREEHVVTEVVYGISRITLATSCPWLWTSALSKMAFRYAR